MDISVLSIGLTLSAAAQSIPQSEIRAVVEPLIRTWESCLSQNTAVTTAKAPSEIVINSVFAACIVQEKAVVDGIRPILLVNGRNMTADKRRQAEEYLMIELREHARRNVADTLINMGK
jgi:hypothetical protein